jgi:AraC-like DNA-binding protein
MQSLTFLHCGYTRRCTAIVDKTFDYYTLQLMTRGGLEVCYDERSTVIQGGWLWTAFPGPHIRFHRAADCAWWEHRYVAFRGSLVSELKAAKLWFDEPQPLPQKRVVSLFDELLENALRTDRWGARRATILLEQILLELAEARAQPANDEAWLERVLTELGRDHDFAPDYETLARACGMGLSTLRRRFKAATGATLHQYVMQHRVGRAKELLGQTDLPLKAIASELNFSDVYFFSSQFRQLVGVAPATYRKSRQL